MNWLTQILSAFGKPFQWWVIIAPWEQGIRVRGGKKKLLLLPGVHFRIPFWDRIYVQNVRQRIIADTNKLLMSRDRKTFCVSTAIEFAVTNIEKLYHSATNIETMLAERAAAAMVTWTHNHNADEITPKGLEDVATATLVEVEAWGLTPPIVRIAGFGELKTYRVVINDFRHGAGLYDIDEVSQTR